MITPENLVRHELIGLKVRIADSSNPGAVGIEGMVVDETRNSLTVEVDEKEKRFIKDQHVFSFYLPDSGKWVRVDGKIIVARPEDRVKKKFRKW